MIKFGSRTTLFIPAEAAVVWQVKTGDSVSAGETVLGKITKTQK
jgi:phosphatidylserine decarboxylase